MRGNLPTGDGGADFPRSWARACRLQATGESAAPAHPARLAVEHPARSAPTLRRVVASLEKTEIAARHRRRPPRSRSLQFTLTLSVCPTPGVGRQALGSQIPRSPNQKLTNSGYCPPPEPAKLAAAATAGRCLMGALEVHERLAIVRHRAQLGIFRVAQIALRLHHEDWWSGDFDAALLGFETASAPARGPRSPPRRASSCSAPSTRHWPLQRRSEFRARESGHRRERCPRRERAAHRPGWNQSDSSH